MPPSMKRIESVVWRRSVTLGLCVGLGACELAKRDFEDTVSGEPDAGALNPVSGETMQGAGPVSNGNGVTREEPSSETDASTAAQPSPTAAPANSTPDEASDEPAERSDSTHAWPGDTSSTPIIESGATTSGETGSRCDQNILENGNFEAGTQGWSASSSYAAFEQRVRPLIVDEAHESLAGYSVAAHEGSRLAFLGDVPDDQYMGYHTTLTQTVFVPEEAAGLAVVGYVWISTAELPEQEWDIGYAQLELPDNDEDYWQFLYWSNLDATEGWVKFDEYIDDLSKLRGKSVNFVLQAVTDADTPTRFWFDDLQLIVVCP